jgi:hypothetical protein
MFFKIFDKKGSSKSEWGNDMSNYHHLATVLSDF